MTPDPVDQKISKCDFLAEVNLSGRFFQQWLLYILRIITQLEIYKWNTMLPYC